MLDIITELRAEKCISELSYQFAKMLAIKQDAYPYSTTEKNLAILLGALVSEHLSQGNSALCLTSEAARDPFSLSKKKLSKDFALFIQQKIALIPPLDWAKVLKEHIAFSDEPQKIAPLLFQNQLLYFYRYWQSEKYIADYFLSISRYHDYGSGELTKNILDQLFDRQVDVNWQHVAVATALAKRFCLISGGPGTGKTRTVAMLLAALQLKQKRLSKPLLNIALVAPTGKAAGRLKESIAMCLAQLNLPLEIKNTLPQQPFTIHHLLGYRPLDMPQYHKKNPLNVDLLVVDEASMIDLTLMEKLLDALPEHCYLILLGDKDQLSSVETGAILAELGEFLSYGYTLPHRHYLTKTTNYVFHSDVSEVPLICDCLCHLKHSYRFSANSGIGQLANQINTQKADASWRILAQNKFDDVEVIHYPSYEQFQNIDLWNKACAIFVAQKAVDYYQTYLELVRQRIKSPHLVSVPTIFKVFQKTRILTALRVSELGTEKLNDTIAESLKAANLVYFKNPKENYCGKPILITRNSPENNVYSGYVGILLPDEQGKMKVYFDVLIEHPDGLSSLSLSLNRLPDYEPAYAMTVHKSQGSEFEHSLLVMPLNYNPILTKELIYTAVTRAKNRFTLFGNAHIWKQAVNTKIERQSGLKAQLLFAENSKIDTIFNQ